MARPQLLVFATGSKNGGGSGFENLVTASRNGILDVDIVAVVSNLRNGGVKEKATRLRVPFVFFEPSSRTKSPESLYSAIRTAYRADFVALSGWLKLVKGLDPRTTFNIHPGPLPEFGGLGMYGHHVHEAVLNAYWDDRLECSAVSMHFVTEKYDKGPIFFCVRVPILAEDTPDSLGKRVNAEEHKFQPVITNLVVHNMISWDGKDPRSLRVPEGYSFLPQK